MNIARSFLTVTLLMCTSPILHAQDARARFRFYPGGYQHFPIPAAGITLAPGASTFIVLQLGLFDADEPVPTGGLAGWRNGSITTSGAMVSRVYDIGRTGPYTFPGGAEYEGVPGIDPFTEISGIYGYEDWQGHDWYVCQPEPPPPTIRGRNGFAAVYVLTVTMPLDQVTPFEIKAEGDALPASHWKFKQEPRRTGWCDCPCDSFGCCFGVFYEPVCAEGVRFSRTILISPNPLCPADWDRSGSADTNDLFAFLSDFFANQSDFDGDGSTNSADFFAFLAAFFAGCA